MQRIGPFWSVSPYAPPGWRAYDAPSGTGEPMDVRRHIVWFVQQGGRMMSDTPRRILIVDDNPVVARALGVLIRQAGFEPVIFHSAEKVLENLGKEAPATAVIDIHLPGSSGLDLSHELRAAYGSNLPIIIVSGDTSMRTLNNVTNAGATHFFSKPVRASQLVQRIRELTGSPVA